jgi:hypothetical protein
MQHSNIDEELRTDEGKRTKSPLSRGLRIVEWFLWFVILLQQFLLHRWRGLWFEDNPSFNRTIYWLIVGPAIVSVLLRWLLLNRCKEALTHFIVFLAGIILAAMSALSTSFLDVPYGNITFLGCLIAIIEFAPIF